MTRLSRFDQHRYIGTRDEMVVYDTDDEAQAATLRDRIDADDLVGALLIQTFGPDTPAEAANRGFHSSG